MKLRQIIHEEFLCRPLQTQELSCFVEAELSSFLPLFTFSVHFLFRSFSGQALL